jgi:hypothetical protein
MDYRLSAGDSTPVVDTLATRSFAWERPTLLVIDNAAQSQPVLARWLDRLFSQQKLDAKLRMLLIDREAVRLGHLAAARARGARGRAP